MALTDDQLTHLYRGCLFQTEAALGRPGWHHQGDRPRAHYGFPRDERLWLFKSNPAEACGHGPPIWVFTLVWLDADSRIDEVETSVVRVHLHGRGEELDVPLAPPDLAAARKAIEALLGPDAAEGMAQKVIPVDLAELIPMVGRKMYERAFGQLISSQRLRRIYDPFDSGDSFVSPEERLRILTDPDHFVSAVALDPSPGDLFHGESLCSLARYRIRRRLGRPERSAENPDLPEPTWMDAFDLGEMEVAVVYRGRHRRVHSVEIMRHGALVFW